MLCMLLVFCACDEDDFLKTEPVDFYSPENSYVSSADYEAAVLKLYNRVRDDFFSSAGSNMFPNVGIQGTDICHLHKDIGFGTNLSSLLLPTNNSLVYDPLWRPAYRIIFDANVIIERANSDNNELTAEEKAAYTAEAKFFRGYMLKMLANLFGGVPLVLSETKSPKRDYTRASRAEVYQQAAADLEEAAAVLPDIDSAPDHKLNRLAAFHLLSEIYISLEQWQDAVDAASAVIDHSSTALMTERFGSLKDEKFLIPQYETDVYWDLFRQGNQNRSSGNTEAIWVLQYEWQTPGGYDQSFGGGPLLERLFSPRAWQAKIENSDGSSSTLVPNPNAYTAGRSSGFTRPSHFFFETLWQRSGYDQDIRNSSANIVRDFIVRNPDSEHNGKWIFKDNLPILMASLNDTTRNMYPWITKTSTPGQQPEPAFLVDPVVEGGLSWSHHAFRDVYAIRLAETYLLRAEAYLGMGDQQGAANDINMVRNRAQAPPISAGEVDIDYILDERARELYLEEFRLLTLTRLGKLVERTRKYNPFDGDTYADHNDLWPIPFSEIEKNIQADLSQNPGY
ncbi:RagB/SusD family nutrient uptake outer membrane protein [Catalinimonas alkaloidigena]|uniref:RagB/SusD family nutrient uptake outer membrane protein n=1 Tax=Catalinimonas alkaloidigena TaxID=1075417 RepID=UPI002406C158|nr:RagB/SusD family nutrient uptake outer membrane protein [Catalinimonas alkaloidigena]